jgi:sodium-dependent dicarboxylate transporter 2/3/5
MADAAVISKKARINWLHVGGAAGAVLAFIVVRSLPIGGLSPQGQGVLATLAAAVIVWITGPIPMGYAAVLAMIVPWFLGYVPAEVAFSGFAGTTFWLLFAALGMGYCVQASGLARRLALLVLLAIGKPTYRRVLLAVVAITLALSYLIPSGLAKMVTVLALFMPLVPLFGLTVKSNVGKGIALAIAMVAYAGMTLMPAGSVVNLMSYGAMQKLGITVPFVNWVTIALVPTLLFAVGIYLFGLWYAKPELQAAPGGRARILQEYRALPALSTKEAWTIAVTLLIVAGWMLDPILKLGITQVGMLGVLLYLLPGIGVTSFGEFVQKAIHWETMLLVGAILGLSAMLPATGVESLLSQSLAPLLSWASSPVLMVLAVALLALAVHPLALFLPTLPLVVPIIAGAARGAGLNPFVANLVYLTLWPMFYFWLFAPQTALVTKDGAVTMKDWVITSAAYFVIWVIVWMVSVLTWIPLMEAMGLLP